MIKVVIKAFFSTTSNTKELFNVTIHKQLDIDSGISKFRHYYSGFHLKQILISGGVAWTQHLLFHPESSIKMPSATEI